MVHCIYCWLQFIISKRYCVSFSEDRFCLSKHCRLDEMSPIAVIHLGLHFTICQIANISTFLGVPSPQSVKDTLFDLSNTQSRSYYRVPTSSENHGNLKNH